MTTSDAAATAAADDPEAQLTPELIKLALVIIVGTFVVQMDGTMVNVAIKTLQQDFDTTVSTIQWISTGYLLSLAMVIPLAGWGVDRFGAKRTWLAALTMFLAGSLLCGVAWSAGSLIAFRVVQGIGGGILLPLSQALLAQAAGPKRMGRLMGMVGIPALLGPIIGPIIGGVIVDDLNWRWIFFINVPICLIAILLSVRVMPADQPTGRPKLDLLGLVLLSPGLAGVVYGLSQAGNHATFNDRHVIIPLVVAGVLLIAFVVHAFTTRTEPIVDLRLLRSRNFSAASVLLFLTLVALLGAMLLLPLYYQNVHGDSALRAGLLLAPQGFGAAVSIAVSGGLVDRFSARPIAITGVLLVGGGLLAFTQLSGDANVWLLSLALLVTGLGFGAVVIPATAVSYRGVNRAAIPRATSALRIFQQIGGSFGVALLAVVLQQRVADAVTGSGGNPSKDALAHAYGGTFWLAVAFTSAALIPAMLLAGKSEGTNPYTLEAELTEEKQNAA